MEFSDEIERVRQVYNSNYRPDPKDRTFPWNAFNPVSIYYRQSQERALVSLFKQLNIDLESLQILDIGCGTGGYLRFLGSLGATPRNLHGIDLMEYRIDMARLLSPAEVDYSVCNAANMPFPHHIFDLVSLFTVFSSILEPGLRQKIGTEIDRVLKPGGILLWYDLSTGRSTNTHGIAMSEILALFSKFQAKVILQIHPVHAASLARRSILLAEIVEHIPGIKKTHILCALKRNTV